MSSATQPGELRQNLARAFRAPDAPVDPLGAVWDEIRELGLEGHVAELDAQGFTVLHDAAPRDVVERLRARILAVFERERGHPVDPDVGEDRLFQIVPLLLREGREFEEALLCRKPLALITYLLGASCRISDQHGMLKGRGSPATPLHTDNLLVPEPFPPYAQTATVNWLLSPYSSADGALCFVPGSHRWGRHPGSADLATPSVAVEAPLGSLTIHHGSVWHGAHARQTPGLRVNLICAFTRLHLQPLADYPALLPAGVIERNPPRFAALVGAGEPWRYRDVPEFVRSTGRIAELGGTLARSPHA